MRTRLPLLCLLIVLPVAAQNAFFGRTTRLPVLGINAPLPAAILLADFNQDGFTDLNLVIGGEGTVLVLLGQASGEFLQSQSFFNQDGYLDVAIAIPESAILILPGAGDGVFRQPVGYPLGAVNSRIISMSRLSGA